MKDLCLGQKTAERMERITELCWKANKLGRTHLGIEQNLDIEVKIVLFDRHLKWETAKDRILAIPQRHE